MVSSRNVTLRAYYYFSNLTGTTRVLKCQFDKINSMNKILFHLIAYPAVGKYTVAQVLKQQAEGLLIDNHLINNVFFSVTDLNKTLPPQVFGYLNKTYELLFEYLVSIQPVKPLILTNCLTDDENDLAFVDRVRRFCQEAGYRYFPVRLLLEESENLNRLSSPERKIKMKLTDPELFKNFCAAHPLIARIPEAKDLDVTGISAEETAVAILKLAAGN